jgi:O-antigen ligase
MLLRGTVRFVVVLGLLAAATLAVATPVVWLHGSDPRRTSARASYIAGALLGAAGFFVGARRRRRRTRRTAGSASGRSRPRSSTSHSAPRCS